MPDDEIHLMDEDSLRAFAQGMGRHHDQILIGSNSGEPRGLLNMPIQPDPLAGVRAVARRAVIKDA